MDDDTTWGTGSSAGVRAAARATCRRLVRATAVVSAVVVMGACTSGSDDEPSAPVEDATSAAPISIASLEWDRCEDLEEGFSIEHPAGWTLDDAEVDRCAAFDPAGDATGPLIQLRAMDARLTKLVSEAEDEGADVDSRILDDREVARVSGEASASLRWLFDLRNGRTLELTGRTSERIDRSARDELLDRMAHGLRWIDPRAAGEGLEPVGAPVTSTVESRIDHPEGAMTTLTDLRAGGHDGFDRVVLEIDGDIEPSYRVEPVGDRQPGADSGVSVSGELFLEVSIAPVQIASGEGRRPSYPQTRVPAAGADVVQEVVAVPSSSTDGELVFAIGMDREASFAVTVIPEPVRLVVDVLHDPVAGESP